MNFKWNGDDPGREDLRSLFRTPNGRLPPLRGIVKEFGTEAKQLRPAMARKVLRDIVHLQQLGILRCDISLRQLINGKIADFSLAITMPHSLSTPELNPNLNSDELAMMEREFCIFSLSDYWGFDTMVYEWNHEECEDPKDQVSVWAHPHKHLQHKFNLRNVPSPSIDRVWTYVDTRLCDWRSPGHVSTKDHKTEVTGRRTDAGGLSKRRKLGAKPIWWYCDSDLSRYLNEE